MSIIKNSNATTNTFATMRSFHDISLNTAADRTGQLWTVLHYIRFTSTSSTPAYYLPLNSPLYSKDTIQLLARVPSDVNGYFFGASTMTISKNGNTVTWTNGDNTATATVTDWDNFHIFGFVDGQAMLDLNILSSWTITDSLRASGGAWFGACSGQTNNVSQIDIQRINIYGKASTTATVRQQKTYYPMIRLDSTSALGFFESRRRRSGVNSTGLEDTTNFHGSYTYSKNSDNTPETVTYGLQLDDLHVMFGNGYHDLIPTVCDDGGVDTERGWDSESAASAFVTGGKSFAFNLAGFPLGTGTIAGTGVTGELMQGRKPKWSIWNDMIKFGFHVENRNGTQYILFNVCKDYKGEWHKPDYDQTDEPKVLLELFDGYNNANSNIHAPSLMIEGMEGGVTVEYHNGYPVTCKFDMEHNLVGPLRYDQDQEDHSDDRNCIFKLTPSFAASVRACLGNLAPWNYHRTELDDTLYSVYGIAVSLLLGDNDNLSLVDIIEYEQQSLSADSDAATKAKYLNERVLGNAEINKDGKLVLFNLLKTGSHYVDATARIRLVNNNHPTPQTSDFISTQQLMGPKTARITGDFDNKVGGEGTSKWRTILDDQVRREYPVLYSQRGATVDWTDIHVGVMGEVNNNPNSYGSRAYPVLAVNNNNRYISIPFLLCKGDEERTAHASELTGLGILPLRDVHIYKSNNQIVRTGEYKFTAIFEVFTYDPDTKVISEYKFLAMNCQKLMDITDENYKSALNAGGGYRNHVIKVDESTTDSRKYQEMNRSSLQWDGVQGPFVWASGVPTEATNLDFHVNFAWASCIDLNKSGNVSTSDDTPLPDNTTVIAHIYSADGEDTPRFITGLVNSNNAGADCQWLPASQTIVQFYDSSNGKCLLFPEYSQIIEQVNTAQGISKTIFFAYCCIWKNNGGSWEKENTTTWPKPSLRIGRRNPDGSSVVTTLINTSDWSGNSVTKGDYAVSVTPNQTYPNRYMRPDGNYAINEGYFFSVTVVDNSIDGSRAGYTYYLEFGA